MKKMYLDTLLIEENLKNIIDGKSTVKEVAKIFRGVEGEYYPVKRTNFDKVYEVI